MNSLRRRRQYSNIQIGHVARTDALLSLYKRQSKWAINKASERRDLTGIFDIVQVRPTLITVVQVASLIQSILLLVDKIYRGNIMKNIVSGIVLACILQCADFQVQNQWTYSGENGPQYWARQYEQCNGIRQSPVHIHTASVKHKPELGQFFFGGHEDIQRLKAVMTNNGKAVEVKLSGVQYIEDGGLSGRYIAIQFHFHWGSEESRGSEHVVNMRTFPMELHIVHYAQKYGNLSTAIGKPDGLAVLSFMFETTEEDNVQFDSLSSRLTNISEPGQTVEVDEFCLKTIFPGDLSKFYRYLGSLTTPPCQESVIWTIFSDTVKISKRQMEMFRRLRKAPVSVVSAQEASQAEFLKDIYLGDNYRPLQELNGREIYSSVEPELMKLGRFERPAFGSAYRAGPNIFYSTISLTTAVLLLVLRL